MSSFTDTATTSSTQSSSKLGRCDANGRFLPLPSAQPTAPICHTLSLLCTIIAAQQLLVRGKDPRRTPAQPLAAPAENT